eukprot:scaffold283_cov316-Pavlova_lutheri.AAC.43
MECPLLGLDEVWKGAGTGEETPVLAPRDVRGVPARSRCASRAYPLDAKLPSTPSGAWSWRQNCASERKSGDAAKPRSRRWKWVAT